MADIEPMTPAHATPVIVTLPAEIDMANECGVFQQLDCALAADALVVVADMTATRFCGSEGPRAPVLAHKRASACSAELRVAVTSEQILRVMAITKLDAVLRIYPSLDAAQEAQPGEAHNPGPVGSPVPSS